MWEPRVDSVLIYFLNFLNIFVDIYLDRCLKSIYIYQKLIDLIIRIYRVSRHILLRMF